MVSSSPATFRIAETHVGFAIVRAEASGYELVWEIVGRSKSKAEARRRYFQALEAGEIKRSQS